MPESPCLPHRGRSGGGDSLDLDEPGGVPDPGCDHGQGGAVIAEDLFADGGVDCGVLAAAEEGRDRDQVGDAAAIADGSRPRGSGGPIGAVWLDTAVRHGKVALHGRVSDHSTDDEDVAGG
jgi:hypothetical protein